MRQTLSVLVGVCALIVPVFAEAQSQPTFSGFTFFMENDVLPQYGDNQDRNYTGGFGFLFGGDFVRKTKLASPVHALDRLTGFDRLFRDPRTLYSALVFGTGFTPDALNVRDPIPGDRPYGSIVGLSVRRLSVNSGNNEEAWSSQVALGFMGLHPARNLQRWLHKRLRKNETQLTPYDPLGWHNQISEGGELTALYKVGYEKGVAGSAFGPNLRKYWQVSTGAEASAGYYTGAAGTASIRLGAFNTDFWQFTPSAMTVGVQVGDGLPRWEAFYFATARPRFVIYNALLQGQFKDSVYTVDPKRLVFEWDLGGAVTYRGFFVIWNAYPGRTAEFKTASPRTHTWGSIQVGFSRSQ